MNDGDRRGVGHSPAIDVIYSTDQNKIESSTCLLPSSPTPSVNPWVRLLDRSTLNLLVCTVAVQFPVGIMWRDSMSLFLPMGVYEPNVVGQSLSALDIVTLVLRVVSPILVAVAAFSLIGTTPPNPASSSPSPIASVVVVNTIPRRAAILALLSLAALTYLLDGITFVVYTVLNKFWQRHTGIELNAVLGLAAFAGLAAFGAVKDVQGVQVWLLRRVRSGVFASLALDIALVVILGVTARKEATGTSTRLTQIMVDSHICQVELVVLRTQIRLSSKSPIFYISFSRHSES